MTTKTNGKISPSVTECHDPPAVLCSLWEMKGGGRTTAQLAMRRAALNEFVVAPNTFQPRITAESEFEVAAHVKVLRDHLERLPPILVFPIDGRLFVLDGHCRLEAWRGALSTDKARAIPIKTFKEVGGKPATFSDALCVSVAANSKDQLPLTSQEKLEGAWRLAIYSDSQAGCFSTRLIESKTGASKSTVATMMATLKASPLGSEGDPREMTWREYRRGLVPSTEWTDEKHANLVRDVARRTRKEFGPFPNRQPQVFAEGVATAYPRMDFARTLLSISEITALTEEAESDEMADF
jgi:hypothetical protein